VRIANDVPRVTISNPNSRGGGARRVARRTVQNVATTSAGQHPLSRNRVWRRSDLDPQIVVPPPQPTVIIANQGYESLGHGKGNSVVVSNLNTTITQADLLELFGDIGTISSYTMINPTTAMISYMNTSDAVEAVKSYHNRLLDGLAMQCTLIPSPGISAAGGASSSSYGHRGVSHALQQALRNTR